MAEVLFENVVSTSSELSELYGLVQELQGDDNTKYELSWANYNLDKEVGAVLDVVADMVEKDGGWNSGLRDHTRPDSRRRYIYEMASVVHPLAVYLKNLADESMLKHASAVMTKLINRQNEVGQTNPFKKIGPKFAKVIKDTIYNLTPTRRHTPLSQDYAASNTVDSMLGVVAGKINKIYETVQSILKVTGISKSVSEEDAKNAAWLLFACYAIPRDLYGKDFAGKPSNPNAQNPSHWYNPDDSMVRQLYNLIANAWRTKDDTPQYDLSSMTDSLDEIDDNANVNGRDEMNSGDYIEKDMSTIGDETSQSNVLNDKTGCTCETYIKVFSVEFLRHLKYSGLTSKLVYRVLQMMFEDVGMPMSTDPVDAASAADFADEFCDRIASIATSTDTAIGLHTELASILREYYDALDSRPKQNDVYDQDFAKFCARLGLKEVDGETVEAIRDALDSVAKNIIYVGGNSVSGKTVDGTSINAVKMPSAVAIFSTESTNDRKKKEGLTAAGLATTKLFRYDPENEELVVGYDDSITGTSGVVDTIPRMEIRNHYKDYISSGLVPVRISENPSWVMLQGLKSYSYLKNGNMADSERVSPLVNKLLDIDATSNVVKDTKTSQHAKATMALSNTKFVDKLVYTHLIPQGASLKERTLLADSVYKRSQGTNLSELLTKTRVLCSNVTKAVSEFANSVGGRYSASVGTVYNYAPKLMTLVSGKSEAINGFVSKMSSEMVESADSALITVLCDVVSTYKDARLYSAGNMPWLLLTVLHDYVRMSDRLVRYAYSHKESPVAPIVQQLYPANYRDVSAEVNSLFDSISNAANKTAEAKKPENSVKIINACKTLIADRENAVDDLSKLADSMTNALTDKPELASLKTLRSRLNDAVNTSDLSTRDVLAVVNAIANTMPGNSIANMAALKKLRINQFDQYVRVMKTLLDAGEQLNVEEPEGASAIPPTYDIPEGGEKSLAELNAMAPQNELNAKLQTAKLDADNAQTDIVPSSDVAEESVDGLKAVLQVFSKYQDAATTHADSSSELGDYMTDAMNLPDAPQESDNWDTADWVKFYIGHPNVKLGYRKHAAKCLARMEQSQKQLDASEDEINNLISQHPEYQGLLYAMVNDEVTLDQMKTVLKDYSIAVNALNELVHYASNDDAEAARNNGVGVKRMFAYTSSDESVMAQLVYVLTNYLTKPAETQYDELLDVLANVRNTVEKFSKNPLSLRLVDYAYDSVKADSDPEKLFTNIVKVITDIGDKFLDRLEGNTELSSLRGMNKVDAPASPSNKYGKAIDSFARSLLRAGDKDTAKESTATGKTDTKEAKARMAYLPYVKADLAENMELSKYAYMLGKAFNTYDRIMRDERVSSNELEKRVFNSTLSSLKGSLLFAKGLCSNDLQRELLSALMDDERNGDKNYPTLASVYAAAKTGTDIGSYSLMHGSSVGTEDKIVNDQRSVAMAFNDKGAKVAPGTGSGIDAVTISELVFGDAQHVYKDDDIASLAHDLRMNVFNKLVNTYGAVDELGDVNFNSDYKNSATELLAEAIKSLYRICDDMETPISAVITVSTSLGQRAGRANVMSYVSDSLKNEVDMDFDTMSMVSGETNAYPQRVSGEQSRVDYDWVDQFADIISKIPEELTPNELLSCVEAYCQNEKSQQQMMSNPKYAEVVRIINDTLRIETSTGVPTGLWGDNSTARKDTIKRLFNAVVNGMDDDKTWAQRADELKQQFMEILKKGGNILSFAGVMPSEAARKRVGHLRMNPYYAVTMPTNASDVNSVIKALHDDGIVEYNGAMVHLKYPGMSLDKNTFRYIVMMSIEINHKITAYDECEAFNTALMFYSTGVRFDAFIDLLERTSQLDDIDSVAVSNATNAIAKSFDVKPYGDMVRTNLGWFTIPAYDALCLSAAMDKRGPVHGFKISVDALTGGLSSDEYDAMISGVDEERADESRAVKSDLLDAAVGIISKAYNVSRADGLVKCRLGSMTDRMFDALCYSSVPRDIDVNDPKFAETVLAKFKQLYTNMATGNRVSYDIRDVSRKGNSSNREETVDVGDETVDDVDVDDDDEESTVTVLGADGVERTFGGKSKGTTKPKPQTDVPAKPAKVKEPKPVKVKEPKPKPTPKPKKTPEPELTGDEMIDSMPMQQKRPKKRKASAAAPVVQQAQVFDAADLDFMDM